MDKAQEEFQKNKDEERYILRNIEFAKAFILEYMKNNSHQSGEELKNGVLDFVVENSQEFVKVANIKNLVFEYEIVSFLMKNPKEVDRLYNKVINENNVGANSYYADKSFEARKEDFIRDLINAVQQVKEENKDGIETAKEYFAGDAKAKKIINDARNNLPPKKREKFDKRIKAMVQGDLDIIKNFLEDFKDSIGEALKQSYINVLVFMGDFFKQNELLDKYIGRNNQNLMVSGLSCLCINKEEFEKNSVFNEEYLNKLELHELPVMTAFWLNRYTKENQSLNEGIFAINALGLWDDILAGKTEFDIDKDQLEAIFCKTEFLKVVYEKIEKSIEKKLNNNTANVIQKCDEVAAINIQDEFDEVEEKVRWEYYNEFEGILPNSFEQIFDDLSTYTPLTSNTINAYARKNDIIVTQVLAYMRSKKIKNWGYICEEKDKKENLVLLGIDYEGYNMPVKVHIPKENLIRGLKEAGLEPIIPIYEGHNDMIVNNQLFKSHIIMNLTEDQEKLIKKLITEGRANKEIMNFLEHLNFLRDNSEYPKHLMEKNEKKGKVTYKRLPKKYINIETGQRISANRDENSSGEER